MRGLSLAWFPAWFPAWFLGRGAERRILEKTRRRGPGVLRPERTRSPAECSHGDESCVTRFSGGTDEKRRGIPATVRKVVRPGFPGERTRSSAGSRNVNESCVASLFFSGSAAVAAGHLVSADPVERVGSYAVALKEVA